ncbi:SusC/RagA family TonB-linked outer membrane protein [Geofilum rubicundum]|uniref:TonB-dependent receptor n=1 Tax=Geofilum rubicundum JCM 15548 TaxID=1236989 RepID=A0A0E9M240_9BACT|nr:TonB-dependent receptor [Geofilum rubicundum]GAO31190.1 TonB-dependent receptor [Geofilum rubicundum JCM 15548]
MLNKRRNLRTVLLTLLMAISISAFAQEISVSGTVVDTEGEPLPGVNIIIKGTTTGAVSDFDGNFQLQVPDAQTAVLLFRFIGFEEQEIAVEGRSSITAVLTPSSIGLDEVVAIGYGTTTKRDLTGSVSSVQGETISKVPVASVAQALTGRMAGVQITTADGSPDAEMIIRVRGGGSVTGDNSPLYIVDGFPVSSINDVAPGDIQSIDVLKDASSTAIYGSQGANGVVIITTKSAKGGKTQVTYNGYMQVKQLAQRLDVLDPYEYVMRNYELAALDGEDGIKGFERRFGVYDDIALYRHQKPIDWQDDMFGADVISQQHNVSINGGTEKTRFSLSNTYNKDGGLMENNSYERYNFNFKLNHDLADNLRFNLNARVSDTQINGSGTSGGTHKIRTTQAVTSPAVKGLDEFVIVNPGSMTDEEYEQYLRSNMSLSEQAAQYWRLRNDRAFNFTGSVDWDIIPGLTYRVEGGFEYGFEEDKRYWGEYTTNASYVDGNPLVDWEKENKTKMRSAHILSYNFDINDVHGFDLMLGQEAITSQGDNNYMYATGYSADLAPEKIFANMGLSSSNLKVTSKVNTNDNLASHFGRFGYNFDDRYLVTLTARADGSSKFAAGNRWGFFPAAAVAWRLSEEGFMAGSRHWLSNLKLRLSYGEAGNNRIASSLYKLEYSIRNNKTYGVGDTPNNYYTATNSQLANPNLRWETTITRNVGLDFGFFNERLSGTLEGYYNSAVDLLIKRNIVAPGYTETFENVGETSNKGVELSLNAFIIEKRDRSFNFNFNIGYNQSNVEHLADGILVQEYASGWAGTDLKGYSDYRVEVGRPLGIIYGWETDGYYTTDDFENYDEATGQYVLKEGVPTTGLLGGKIGIRPGTLKLKDQQTEGEEGYGVVDEGDRTIIGNATPDFTGGFGFNGTFKGFDASVMFNFVYGNDIYNANKIASSQQYRTSNPNLLAFMAADNSYTYLDRSSGELVTDLATLREMNEGANAKEYWSPYSFGNATVVPHSWAIEDGSFLRFQNLTLGYTLPTPVSQRIGSENLRIYGTLNNIWVWTNYTGYDPEVSSPVRGSAPSGLTPGVDYSSYPKSFSWTLGINLTF